MFSINQIHNKKIWESFLERRKNQNFLQSWCWGETQKLLGNKIFRLGVYSSSMVENSNNLQGVALLIKEKARRGSYLTCPAGPLLDWENGKIFSFFVRKIKDLGLKENVSFVRIRPQLLDTPENQNLFKNHGFIPAPMHMHAETTWQLDLKDINCHSGTNPDLTSGEVIESPTKTEEQLLKGMSKNHRYEIRKAEKRGVEAVLSKSLGDVEILYKIQLETAKRHNFVPFSRKLLIAEFEVFLGSGNIVLFKALWQGKPVACAMIVYYGLEAVYHYAATTDEGRQVSAAYLILWKAIKEAKRRKMKRFNFWGVAPIDKKNHRFAQLNHFKKGFGGQQIDYLHAQDLPIKSTYWFTFAFEAIRRKLRKL